MAFRRIINRSYLKYASSRFTRSYSQASLASSVNYAAKQSKICSSDNLNSDICRKPYSVIENVRFLSSLAQARMKKEDAETDGPRLNEQITAQVVRLVTEEGHCVLPRSEALRRAKLENLDLVEVQRAANPPVCKIMNYNREKYLKATKEKERAKAKRSETTLRAGIKEIQFNPKIELKDLKFKADQAMRMMERGYRVKCMAVPDKNKDIEPAKLAELLSRFIPFIEDSVVESGPSVERKQAFVVVRHVKFGESKKGGTKKLKDMDIKTAVQAPPPKEDSEKDESCVAEETEATTDSDADSDHAFNQDPPVESHNRYAKREPSNQFVAKRSPEDRGPVGRETNRYGSRYPNQPLNPQASQPRFPSQAPNQHPTPFEPRYPSQPPNPQASQPRFPNQAPKQHPTPFEPRRPNQPLNPQASPPRFPNQAPKQHPSPFEPRSPNQPPNPQPSQPRLPNQAPNQQPTGPGRSSGPASGYGIFSNPKTNPKDR